MCGATQHTADRLFVFKSTSLIKHKHGIITHWPTVAAYEAEWISAWRTVDGRRKNQFFIFIMCKWLISEWNALTLACFRSRSCLILPEGYQTMRWDYRYASGISKGNHDDLLPHGPHTPSRLTATPGIVTQAFDSVKTLSFVFVLCSGLDTPPFVSRFQTCRFSPHHLSVPEWIL